MQIDDRAPEIELRVVMERRTPPCGRLLVGHPGAAEDAEAALRFEGWTGLIQALDDAMRAEAPGEEAEPEG